MASARCPVCSDINSFGVSVKLNQIIICPTCLASLEVVSLNPLELDLPERPAGGATQGSGRNKSRKNSRDLRKKTSNKRLELDSIVEDDFDELDDYTLEKKLRYKSDAEKRRRGSVRE